MTLQYRNATSGEFHVTGPPAPHVISSPFTQSHRDEPTKTTPDPSFQPVKSRAPSSHHPPGQSDLLPPAGEFPINLPAPPLFPSPSTPAAPSFSPITPATPRFLRGWGSEDLKKQCFNFASRMQAMPCHGTLH
ncbi:unnamed protein product [Closterium sp. NIES-53]